jgi:hypothetical protein
MRRLAKWYRVVASVIRDIKPNRQEAGWAVAILAGLVTGWLMEWFGWGGSGGWGSGWTIAASLVAWAAAWMAWACWVD